MQIDTQLLIQELQRATDTIVQTAQTFKRLSPAQLNYKEETGQWSILECLEHLNLYGDFYLPELEKQLAGSTHASPKSAIFKSGLIGNYLVNMIRVKAGRLKKMSAPKDKMPNSSGLTPLTIDRFLKQQQLLKSILLRAEAADMVRVTTAISLTKHLRLRLGDTLRFMVYHNERHILQAGRMLHAAGFAGA